jgi:hypothetical protein
MKCSNPNGAIAALGVFPIDAGGAGTVRVCRDAFRPDLSKQSQQEPSAMTYVEWLFSQPIESHGRS